MKIDHRNYTTRLTQGCLVPIEARTHKHFHETYKTYTPANNTCKQACKISSFVLEFPALVTIVSASKTSGGSSLLESPLLMEPVLFKRKS